MPREARSLVAGRDYPRGEGDFRRWFATDEACADYIGWLRWPTGFVCPRCTAPGGYRLSDGRWWCDECRRRVSVTSGTIFSHTRTPLTIWFVVAWEMAAHSTGVSARTLYRLLGFGSYETAWAILHRYRHAISARGLDLLDGVVEVDESYFGGEHKAGRPGRSSAEGKYEVLLAVERKEARGFGRVRARYIEHETDAVIGSFIGDTIVRGATVHSDGAPSYRRLFADPGGALTGSYRHERSIIAGSGHEAHELLPGVHRVASLAQRWIAGTHQGRVEADHLQSYLDEFCFRFNRRSSRSRGLLFYRLLELAVAAGPHTYAQIISGTAKPKEIRPMPPAGPRRALPSLAIVPVGRPWRR